MLKFFFLLHFAILAESPVKFDFQLSYPVVGLVVCCLIFPFLPHLQFPLLDGVMVTAIESIQALMLLGFAIFTFFYIRPYDLSKNQRQFWLWSIAWWILLFGRSTSWGRDYFPEVPKIYFRGISILVIAPVLFMLLLSPLRAEIAHKFKQAHFSFWAIVLVVLGLAASDGIEHGRGLGVLLLNDAVYKDFLEECFEFPLIIGLFLIAYPMLIKDCIAKKKQM